MREGANLPQLQKVQLLRSPRMYAGRQPPASLRDTTPVVTPDVVRISADKHRQDLGVHFRQPSANQYFSQCSVARGP